MKTITANLALPGSPDQNFRLTTVCLKDDTNESVLKETFSAGNIEQLLFLGLYEHKFYEPVDWGPGYKDEEVWHLTRGQDVMWNDHEMRFSSGEGIYLSANEQRDQFKISAGLCAGFEIVTSLSPEFKCSSGCTVLEFALWYEHYRGIVHETVESVKSELRIVRPKCSTYEADTGDLPF